MPPGHHHHHHRPAPSGAGPGAAGPPRPPPPADGRAEGPPRARARAGMAGPASGGGGGGEAQAGRAGACLQTHSPVLQEVLAQLGKHGTLADLCNMARVCRAFRRGVESCAPVWRDAFYELMFRLDDEVGAPGPRFADVRGPARAEFLARVHARVGDLVGCAVGPGDGVEKWRWVIQTTLRKLPRCRTEKLSLLGERENPSNTVRTYKGRDRVSGRLKFVKECSAPAATEGAPPPDGPAPGGADPYFLREVAGLRELGGVRGVLGVKRVYNDVVLQAADPRPPEPWLQHTFETEWIERTLKDCLLHTYHPARSPVAPGAAAPHFTLTPGRIRRYMWQLLTTVHETHRQDILHRDINPYNIRVCQDRAEARLGNFRFARRMCADADALTPTVVTLWYRAPEILLGASTYGAELDVWSLGCVFFELATGSPLFPGGSELETLFLIFRAVGTPAPGNLLRGLPEFQGDFPQFAGDLDFHLTLPAYRAAAAAAPGGRGGDPPRPLAATVGAAGKALLKQMLNSDPRDRITAEAALRHEYFRGIHGDG